MNIKNGTVLMYGELLWDILPSGPVLGGAPANGCFRLQTLGHAAVLVSRVGDDEIGKKALEILENNGVNISYVQVDKTVPTGTVDVTLSPEGNASYVINRGVAYDQIELTPALKALAPQVAAICFGTLIQRTPVSRNTLMRILDAAPQAVKILDINLRKDCYSLETVSESLKRADIVKLNDSEAEVLASMLDIPIPNLRSFADALMSRFDIKVCLITKGANGVFGRSQTEECDLPGIQVKVADTIGSGDAFNAAFIHAYLEGHSLVDCCTAGNRLGALVASRQGGMSVVSSQEIADFRP
jgi:fructokinase